MPTSVPGVPVTGATTSMAPPAKPTNQLDKDAFLKLMVAQLRYQNPMSPADPESMLAQTAQFSTVEKLEELTSLIAESGRAQRLQAGAALIGKEVVAAAGTENETVRGVVTSATRTVDDVVLLRVGELEIPLDDVQQVF
ncbi:MAG: flagellar hook capping protein [Acidimicrobiia bacterium]|nr:flagellar hook capping protein [Acidimicrobiia bacterium]